MKKNPLLVLPSLSWFLLLLCSLLLLSKPSLFIVNASERPFRQPTYHYIGKPSTSSGTWWQQQPSADDNNTLENKAWTYRTTSSSPTTVTLDKETTVQGQYSGNGQKTWSILYSPKDDAATTVLGNRGWIKTTIGIPKTMTASTKQEEEEKSFSSSTSILTSTTDTMTPPKQHKRQKPVLTASEQLRHVILDQGKPLRSVKVQVPAQNNTYPALFDHAVVELIVKRAHERSKPGHRSIEDAQQNKLALVIEGGGMRGAVSAGMVAALMCLGLSDVFDTIYGSSAGSVIGAYLVSRQLCMDVYVDILPAAKDNFLCLRRLWKSIGLDLWESTVGKKASAVTNIAATMAASSSTTFATVTTPKTTLSSRKVQPGLNTSFIIEEIMHPERGVRPLDLTAFLHNNQHQPLHIAATYTDNGRLIPHVFGGRDFTTVQGPDGRNGVIACLQASMNVPGAAGPPLPITTPHDGRTRSFFDAFCCEPIPYRSAVEHGATHCLVLCTRPDGYVPKTKPGIYDTTIAPIYFTAHGETDLANFFKVGGQLYVYAEDLLTLLEGQLDRSPDGVLIPPSCIMYGVEHRDEQAEYLSTHRNEWRKAHLLPIKVPVGTSELPTLENKRDSVLEAVRAGFAVVYDIFAPALGLEIDDMDGRQVAMIVFPDGQPETVAASAKTMVRQVLDSLPGLEGGSFVGFRESIHKVHNLS
jgi:predicted patatin/cPLA2 family phospholipase